MPPSNTEVEHLGEEGGDPVGDDRRTAIDHKRHGA
jgi:hypothetical protein